MTLTPELEQAVAEAGRGAGPSRIRQLRWVAGELMQAMDAFDWHPRSPAELFDDRFLDRYLDAAEQGQFRRRAASRDSASSQASARVRRSCLTALIEASGCQAHAVPATGPSTDPRTGAAPEQVARALEWWWSEATAPGALSTSVRAAAIAHLVAENGLRTGELAATTVEDLDLSGRRLVYTPAPQAARSAREPESLSLSYRATELLRTWLHHRAAAVVLTPHITALWVTLAGNHLGERVLPAGLPLQPRGILRAHSGSVERLNAALAGTRGWQPLSTVLADLRRAGPEETPPSPA